MTERLSLDMEHHADGVVLRLAGHLDAATAPLLAGALNAVDERRHGAVTVDLEGVVAIDGAGIRLLLEAESAAAAAGRRFETHGLPASLRRRTTARPVGGAPAPTSVPAP